MSLTRTGMLTPELSSASSACAMNGTRRWLLRSCSVMGPQYQLGMAELLLESGLSPSQEALARSVSQSGEHLLAIINDILDFSKIESGKLELEHRPFDLTAVVEAAVELMAPAAQAKGVELNYWLEPEVPVRFLGGSERDRKVLLNLIGNAVKFTAQGEIAVS